MRCRLTPERPRSIGLLPMNSPLFSPMPGWNRRSHDPDQAPPPRPTRRQATRADDPTRRPWPTPQTAANTSHHTVDHRGVAPAAREDQCEARTQSPQNTTGQVPVSYPENETDEPAPAAPAPPPPTTRPTRTTTPRQPSRPQSSPTPRTRTSSPPKQRSLHSETTSRHRSALPGTGPRSDPRRARGRRRGSIVPGGRFIMTVGVVASR
jgi:hypothetical protein